MGPFHQQGGDQQRGGADSRAKRPHPHQLCKAALAIDVGYILEAVMARPAAAGRWWVLLCLAAVLGARAQLPGMPFVFFLPLF